MNVTLFCDRQNIKLLNDEVRVTKPKTTFFLDKKHDLLSMNGLRVCDFSDRYALNIVKLVNLEEYRLYEMKSHDCHVFIQTLIPIAYRDSLLKKI
jgi:hypothetical protein